MITALMLSAICHGPVVTTEKFRGVVVDEGAVEHGSGQCCPLEGLAFACLVHLSHQHGPVIVDNLRFYDRPATKPRVDLVVFAMPNPGMRGDHWSPPFAELGLTKTTDGFVLTPAVKGSCDSPRPEAREVCRNRGRWVFRERIPERP